MSDDTSTAAADAVNYYLEKLQESTSVLKECNVQTVTSLQCNLSEVKLKNCDNIDLTCCNNANVEIMKCPDATFIKEVAVEAITQQTSKNKLVLEFAWGELRKRGYNEPDIKTNIENYLVQKCSNFSVTYQANSLQLDAANCKNGSIALYNQSDANIRCGAASISNILPKPAQPPAAPEPPPASTPFFTIHTLAKYVLIGLGSVFVALVIACIAVAASNAALLKQPAPVSLSVSPPKPAASIVTAAG